MAEFDDAALQALFAADASSPTVDHGFVAEVAQRIARRRLMFDLAQGAGASGLAALVLWALGPVMQAGLAPLGQAALALLPALAVAAGAVMIVQTTRITA